jgi:hypothetical protein
MSSSDPQLIFDRLETLRIELIDLAFTLDCGGNPSAADVAMTTAARLAELCAERSQHSMPTAASAL